MDHIALNLAGTSETEVLPYCNSVTEFGDRTNAFCGFYSFAVVVGGMAGCVWFMLVGLNLYLMLQFDFR